MDINLKTSGIIEITLKRGEIFIGERGSMSSCDGGVKLTAIQVGLYKSLKRFISGESFLSIVKFENTTLYPQNLILRYDISKVDWFHHNQTETEIFFIDLSSIEGDLVISKGAFFAATSGVDVDVFFDNNFGRSVFGFGSVFKQKISGTGTVFIKKNRWFQIEVIKLEKNRKITIDPKEIYAYSSDALSKTNKSNYNNFLTGEGFSSYEFVGPATIYKYKNQPLNSSPFNIYKIVKIILFIIIIKMILNFIFS